MISRSISEKLLQLAAGENLPASQLQHEIIRELIGDGIILGRVLGRTKSTLYIQDTVALSNWLFNRFSIRDLAEYVNTLKNEEATRADLIHAGNDSKLAARRTFKGFLINSYVRIEAFLNGNPFTFIPVAGTFQFIYDFESFIPAPDIVIVGIENAENFRWVEKLQYLFKDVHPLFVCRYPQGQGKDLLKWLYSVPNRYLHFGDYDFAGINIYQQEYKKHLGEQATFFIPANIEHLIEEYGNRKLYDQQQLNTVDFPEDGIQRLVSLLHKYKKGLEQEALIGPK